jgi:hypothetical protein
VQVPPFFVIVVSARCVWWLVESPHVSQSLDKSKSGDKRVGSLSREFGAWTAYSELGRQLRGKHSKGQSSIAHPLHFLARHNAQILHAQILCVVVVITLRKF